MKIAIIGAGFCGLSTAFFLARSGKAKITIFDRKGIGAGASGITAGLLHPYPGEKGRLSWRAFEALSATYALLKEVEKMTSRTVACYDGIIRVVGQERFFIRSGITVDCKEYLAGLWEAVHSMGAELMLQEVKNVSELEGYDCIILASGNGIFQLEPAFHLFLSQTRGQVLQAHIPKGFSDLTHSLVGKGYLAWIRGSSSCYLGSTYERGNWKEVPDFELACSEILPKMGSFFPKAAKWDLIDCQAGVRVKRVGHYYPVIKQINPFLWAITAMGSRGLLYHAFAARILSEAILSDDTSVLPLEMR